MKREIISTQTVSHRGMSPVMSANIAARFIVAQLFFGYFCFWFPPMPI